MRRSLGLEIGATGIRWVELEEERGRISVRASGTATITGAERAVGETLRALAAERRWRGREAVVSLPRAAVTLRWITLPSASREETTGMVELEAVQSLPFQTDEAAWDFVSFPLPDARQEVLVVAARRPLVQDLRQQVEAAGLRLGAVAVDAMAATALYQTLHPAADTEVVLLDLERGVTTLSFVREGRLLLSRSVTVERQDAETLAVEVRRTLVAGMMAGASTHTPSTVDAIWLTGEGASEGLARELGALLGPQGALLPKDGLAGGAEISPSHDTALGLALLGLRPAPERLDLARTVRGETDRRATGRSRRLPLLAGAGAVALIVVLLLLFGPRAGDRDLASAAARAQADARQMETKRKQMETQVRMLNSAVAPEHSYLDVLNDVSALAGADVWLTQYSYDRGRPLVIRGTARSNDAVARLVEGLRRSRHLDRVDLGSVTRADTDKSKNKISVVQFMITGTLQGDQPLQLRRSRAARPTRQVS